MASVARRFELSGHTATLTGSYVDDLEQYPGLWGDVYLYLNVKQEEEEFVEKAYADIKKRQGGSDG